MGWAKLDDGFDDHPKVMSLLDEEEGAAAVGLWTLCLTWANRNTRDRGNTPGLLPASLPRRFIGPAGARLADLLVLHRLWTMHDGPSGGWLIHGFSDYQPSAELREKRRQAGRKGAAARHAKKDVSAGQSGKLPTDPSNLPKVARQTASKPLATAGEGEGVSVSSSRSSSVVNHLGGAAQSAASTPDPKPSTARGTRLPEGWQPTPALVAWFRERCPDLTPQDGKLHTEKFCNHFHSAAGAKGRKVDWGKAWQNWMLEEQQRAVERAARRQPRRNGMSQSERAAQVLRETGNLIQGDLLGMPAAGGV